MDLERLQALVLSGPTPLFATVSGAHLYGFESADSDVDLRGAFVLPLRDVAGLVRPSETITVSGMHEGLEMDWVAHDIAKFARLMTRRNGYVLEQLYSPLVAYGGSRLDELRAIGQGCMVRHLYHHYRGFYFNKRKTLTQDGATVKDLLYAWRVLLTGIHVLRTGVVEANLANLNRGRGMGVIDELIARKRGGAEHAALSAEEAEAHLALLDEEMKAMTAAFETSGLPESPTTLDALNDFVIRARLELGQTAPTSLQMEGPSTAST
jgi:predicted nucleotidyltransferase